MTIRHPALRRTARFASRTAAFGSAAALALSIWGLSTGLPNASAAAVNAGPAQVVTPPDQPGGGGAPLNSGGSATSFSLKLTPGAACTKDSANGGYRVQSYFVPSSVSPASLTFDASGPIGHQPLYDTTGSPYVDKQTANADPANGPGTIVNIATFSYKVYPPGQLAPGTYNLGIACTLGPASATQVDRYWNVQKTFTADAADQPTGVRWTVVAASNDTTTTTSSTSSTSTSTTSSTSSTTTTTTAPTSGSSTTSTTRAGGASTTTTTTAAGAASTSGGAGGGPRVASSGASAGGLPRTGTSPLALATWAFLLLCFGRMAVLLGRTPTVVDPPS